MTDTPLVLLAHHLKTLKLPLREYDKIARQCASEGVDHVRYLLRLAELELIDRERRMVERRIKAARFPVVKSLDSFDFKVIRSTRRWSWSWPAASTSSAARTSSRSATVGPARYIALGLGLSGLPDWPLGRLHHRRRAGPRSSRPAMTQLLRFQKSSPPTSFCWSPNSASCRCRSRRRAVARLQPTGRYERGATLVKRMARCSATEQLSHPPRQHQELAFNRCSDLRVVSRLCSAAVAIGAPRSAVLQADDQRDQRPDLGADQSLFIGQRQRDQGRDRHAAAPG